MKGLIQEEITRLQDELDGFDEEKLNNEIKEADQVLNGLLLIRSNMLKEKKKIQDEVDFLNAMIAKCDELNGIVDEEIEDDNTDIEDDVEEKETEDEEGEDEPS